MNNPAIYFDNNATTPLAPEVVDAMLPFFRDHFGNPSSPHRFARKPAMAVAAARQDIASLIDAPESSIIFTSGGTESNAMAILGALEKRAGRNEVILSSVEHASVWTWRNKIIRQGHTLHVIPVDSSGRLDIAAYAAALSDRTALVSVMLANNETGIVHPIKSLATMAHAVGAKFHTDASQAIGKMPVSVTDLGVDFATGCGHKYHAPKGIGFLYIREPQGFPALLNGGEQEFGLRPGTESVASCVGLGTASQLARTWLAGDGPTTTKNLRDLFESWTQHDFSHAIIVGDHEPRLSNTTLLLIPGIETEPLLALLDLQGVACSSGSACASGAHEPSHVLTAMGLATRQPTAVIRISSNRWTTASDYEILRKALISAVKQPGLHVS